MLNKIGVQLSFGGITGNAPTGVGGTAVAVVDTAADIGGSLVIVAGVVAEETIDVTAVVGGTVVVAAFTVNVADSVSILATYLPEVLVFMVKDTL